jgi:hypothetical protein
VLPTSADTIVFDGTSSRPVYIDPDFTSSVAGMQISSSYGSNVTLQEDFTVTGGLTQTGRTIFGTSNLTLLGNSTVTGGAN